MGDHQDLSWRQAWKRKLSWAEAVDRQVARLRLLSGCFLFTSFVCMLLFLLGIAPILSSFGGLVCILLSIAFGVGALVVNARSYRKIDAYRQAIGMPPDSSAPRGHKP